MTFSYNTSLPNPPDEPADDVFGMQTNTASIGGIIAVDHVGFNKAGGGQHVQVTFNANNVPVITPPATTYPVTAFTDSPANHGGIPTYPQLFFYTGTTTQSSNQYVLTGTGSVLLMGGIILKWGTYTILANQAAVGVSFAGGGFPNNAFGLNITPTSITAATDYQVRYTLSGTSGFQGIRGTGVPTTASYFYIAIGN